MPVFPKTLKKDIVIPAGTVFHQSPTMTRRYGDDHFECNVSLSNNTCGFLNYCIGEDDADKLKEWFE